MTQGTAMQIASASRRALAEPAGAGPLILLPKQVAQLLAAPDRRTHLGRRDAALLAVMALGGLRVGEAVRLQHTAVQDTGTHVRLVFTSEKSRGKRRRTVTLPPLGRRLLREWLTDTRVHPYWVFAGRHNEHLSPAAAREMVSKRCRAAGLPIWMHPHSLRHTFASTIMRETSNLYTVQRLLGHTSPEQTAKYYLAFSAADADRGAEALDRAMHPRRARRV